VSAGRAERLEVDKNKDARHVMRGIMPAVPHTPRCRPLRQLAAPTCHLGVMASSAKPAAEDGMRIKYGNSYPK
jgi:hypothetical protein